MSDENILSNTRNGKRLREYFTTETISTPSDTVNAIATTSNASNTDVTDSIATNPGNIQLEIIVLFDTD